MGECGALVLMGCSVARPPVPLYKWELCGRSSLGEMCMWCGTQSRRVHGTTIDIQNQLSAALLAGRMRSVSWRSLLLPTAGMMSAAVSVAALRFLLTTIRETSAHTGDACDARAFG